MASASGLVDGGDASEPESNVEEGNEDDWDEEMEVDNAGQRRQRMRQAIKEGELANPEFQPDDEDDEWEKQVFRKAILNKSRKITSNPGQIDPAVFEAIETGGDIPKHLQRQVPNTAKIYIESLRLIAGFYQRDLPSIELHYRNFVAFGTDNFVRLASPKRFIENWTGASLEKKKTFVSSHNWLVKIVKKEATSNRGLLDFSIPYIQTNTPGEAGRLGLKDKAEYIAHLKEITEDVDDEHYWREFARQIEAKRVDKQETMSILWGLGGGEDNSEGLSEAIFKYMESSTVQEAENSLITAAHDPSQPFSNKKFIKSTRYLVTKIQIIHGTRQEAQNMTVKEWDSRRDVPGSPGLVYISRKFTKLAAPTILVLGLPETALCILYDIVKRVKFPKLVRHPDYRKTSFFVNSKGNAYSDQHGNGLHLTDWNRITKRGDSVNNFRELVSDYSLTQDDVTRVNLAFANNHSPATMCKVYAQAGEKVLQGIHTLLKYREEQLNQPNIPVIKIRLPKDAQNRERANKVLDYDELLASHVEIETRTHKHISMNKGSANQDSRCSLVELCAAEIKSGPRINDVFLADLLMRESGYFFGIPVKVQAILRVIDSFEFADQIQSISLQEFLVDEARRRGPKNDNDIDDHLVDSIEDFVIRGWLNQIKKMRNPGIPLQGYRMPAAFLTMAIASGSSDYCLGSDLIAKRVRAMRKSREPEEKDEEENNEETMSPTSIVQLNRKKYGKEEKEEDTMSPITTSAQSSPTASPRCMRFQVRQLHSGDSDLSDEIPSTPRRPTAGASRGEKSKISRRIELESSSDEEILHTGVRRKNTQQILDSSSDEEDGQRGEKRKYTETNLQDSDPDFDLFEDGSSPSRNKEYQQRGEKGNYTEDKKTRQDFSTDEEQVEVQMVLLEQAQRIKVETASNKKRLMPWTKGERVNLLTGVLDWMIDPTLPYQKKGKMDLMTNVSPRVTENRPYASVQDQYYRFGSPETREDSMQNWLEKYVTKTLEIEWNVDSLRQNKQIIIEAYKDPKIYTRKS